MYSWPIYLLCMKTRQASNSLLPPGCWVWRYILACLAVTKCLYWGCIFLFYCCGWKGTGPHFSQPSLTLPSSWDYFHHGSFFLTFISKFLCNTSVRLFIDFLNLNCFSFAALPGPCQFSFTRLCPPPNMVEVFVCFLKITCAPYGCSIQGYQKRASDPLKLQIKTVVSDLVGAGSQTHACKN